MLWRDEERKNGGDNKYLQDLDPKDSLHLEDGSGDFGRWRYRSRSPLAFP
jgi:hypothetical protein